MLKDPGKTKAVTSHTPLFKDYTYVYYRSVAELEADLWDQALPSPNFFLSYHYLKCVEELKADENYFRYVIVYQHGKSVGVAYFQVTDFTPGLFGNMIENQFKSLSQSSLRLFKHKLEKHNNRALMRLLTCGNNYVSGEHGFLFDPRIEQTLRLDLLEKLIKDVGRKEKLRGRISGTLIKDFFEPLPLSRCMFGTARYIEFKVEPNMIVTIPDGVNSIADYLASFSKKYRNRARQILKAAETIVVKDLDSDDIHRLYQDLFTLYENVYNNAKFKLAKLDARYFYEMKKTFGSRFLVTGYFKDGRLVSFSSAIILGHEVEAHYIGIDYEINKEYELYQNILYRYIDIALTHGIRSVNLGRTASEIKSTVGARPADLYCYIKPQNTISKLVLRPFISFLQPTQWIPRNPFKENDL